MSITEKECTHCKKPIEDWAYGNKDKEGNEYCMDCVSQIVCGIEMEETQ